MRVGFLASSDTPVNIGGRPTIRPREAAVDATSADGAASGAATGPPPRIEYAGDHRSSGSRSVTRENHPTLVSPCLSCPLSSLPKDGFPNPQHGLLPRLVHNLEYGRTCLL